jgi:ornithine--oxo-acid transaminase
VVGLVLISSICVRRIVLNWLAVFGMEKKPAGDHGSTFGRNPLGCAVARESLKVLVEEKLIE